MLVKRVTNHVVDLFSDAIGTSKTGWEPDLWIRVFVKNGKVEFLKGNRSLLKQAVTAVK